MIVFYIDIVRKHTTDPVASRNKVYCKQSVEQTGWLANNEPSAGPRKHENSRVESKQGRREVTRRESPQHRQTTVQAERQTGYPSKPRAGPELHRTDVSTSQQPKTI